MVARRRFLVWNRPYRPARVAVRNPIYSRIRGLGGEVHTWSSTKFGDGAENKKSYEYRESGDPCCQGSLLFSSSSANTFRSESFYDGYGRVLRRIGVDGLATEYIYHPGSTRLIVVASADAVFQVKYSDKGNPALIESFSGQRIALLYSADGLLDEIIETDMVRLTIKTFRHCSITGSSDSECGAISMTSPQMQSALAILSIPIDRFLTK